MVGNHAPLEAVGRVLTSGDKWDTGRPRWARFGGVRLRHPCLARASVEGTALVLQVSGYQGQEIVGRGASGVVYRATQLGLERTVAVKVLAGAVSAESFADFERECRTLGQVDWCPEIVTVYDTGADAQGQPYLVMEFCPGGSLADRLASSGPIGRDEVVQIARHVARALVAAHEAGVLHRDIKPANILISRRGLPVLGDFGIARLTNAQTLSVGVTGTIAYTAPEVLLGGRASQASDIFSFGALLFTLLTGRSPYALTNHDSVQAMITRAIMGEVRASESLDIDHALRAVMNRCLAREPADRFASARELLEALEELPLTEDRELRSTDMSSTPPTISAVPAVPPTIKRAGGLAAAGPAIAAVARSVDEPGAPRAAESALEPAVPQAPGLLGASATADAHDADDPASPPAARAQPGPEEQAGAEERRDPGAVPEEAEEPLAPTVKRASAAASVSSEERASPPEDSSKEAHMPPNNPTAAAAGAGDVTVSGGVEGEADWFAAATKTPSPGVGIESSPGGMSFVEPLSAPLAAVADGSPGGETDLGSQDDAVGVLDFSSLPAAAPLAGAAIAVVDDRGTARKRPSFTWAKKDGKPSKAVKGAPQGQRPTGLAPLSELSDASGATPFAKGRGIRTWWSGLRRGRRILVLATIVVVTLSLGFGGLLAYKMTHPTVVLVDGKVRIDRGVRFGSTILGKSGEVNGVLVTLLPEETRKDLTQGLPLPSSPDVYFDLLRSESKPKRPILTARRADWPQGDTFTLSWTPPDGRDGVVTTLVDDKGKPLPGCPATLTAVDSCRTTIPWGTSMTVSAVARFGSSIDRDEEYLTAERKPALNAVYVGPKVRSDNLTYCSIDVNAVGLQPNSKLSYWTEITYNDGAVEAYEHNGDKSLTVTSVGEISLDYGAGVVGTSRSVTFHMGDLSATVDLSNCH